MVVVSIITTTAVLLPATMMIGKIRTQVPIGQSELALTFSYEYINHNASYKLRPPHHRDIDHEKIVAQRVRNHCSRAPSCS